MTRLLVLVVVALVARSPRDGAAITKGTKGGHAQGMHDLDARPISQHNWCWRTAQPTSVATQDFAKSSTAPPSPKAQRAGMYDQSPSTTVVLGDRTAQTSVATQIGALDVRRLARCELAMAHTPHLPDSNSIQILVLLMLLFSRLPVPSTPISCNKKACIGGWSGENL